MSSRQTLVVARVIYTASSVVLSIPVTREHLVHWHIPLLTPEDIEMMATIVRGAIPRIASLFDEANAVVEHLYEDLASLEPHIRRAI